MVRNQREASATKPTGMNAVERVGRDDLMRLGAARIEKTRSLLDVGSGIQPFVAFRPRVHVCVEAYTPYVERLLADSDRETPLVVLNGSWADILRYFPDQSVDTVVGLDFVEHLEKAEGLRFIAEAIRICRRQVVLFTPLGFYEQSYEDVTKPDRWGMHGGLWQTHRSGWNLEDFGEGWSLLVCEDYYTTDQHDQPLKDPSGALWAYYTKPWTAAARTPPTMRTRLKEAKHRLRRAAQLILRGDHE
jgi:hypothetical protein